MVPLYKRLKENGITFYAFPGSSEDISASYQNSSYKMYFSKYALLHIPEQSLSVEPKYFDFDVFIRSDSATPAYSFSDLFVESLRNYVANQEVVIRESRLNSKEYYYNSNSLQTTSEKIFWKWCKKLNIIDFEPAIPSDEYFSNLPEFSSNNINDDEYFPEYLWKEREILDWNTIYYKETDETGFLNKLEIVFDGSTNFKVGDIVNIFNVSNDTILSNVDGTNIQDSSTEDGINTKVLKVKPSGATQGSSIIVDINTTLPQTIENTGQARLVYNRLVRYIGEVNGVSNVQEANRSYTEVHALIPDHTGQTPDILFRTTYDDNYKPNMTFPIIPSQYQPEILGAENFKSPIVSSPQNYPGSYFGQFDTLDFTYVIENGDYLRRSGDYFGIKGDINNITIDSSKLDGLGIDFNMNHYVKMNIPNKVITNFDQFNALSVDNNPPKDFEFNAILWYYTIEDDKGNKKSNLYGITILDHPDNNTKDDLIGLKFPTYKKLVTNGQQDGTSYSFNLSLNFNLINENPIEVYNPESINSLFSMNLFNKAMSRLASVNDSFLNIIAEQNSIRSDLSNIKSLLYTQTDINILNKKISNLETLLKLYSTLQMKDSNSIKINTIPSSPPYITLDDISTDYYNIININTTELFNQQGVLPISISIPLNRNLLVNIINDDSLDLNFDSNLSIILDRDLYLNQTIDISVNSTNYSLFNKFLDIYMMSDSGSTSSDINKVLILGDIDLPVYYNNITNSVNSAYMWKDFGLNIDFNKDIFLSNKDKLNIPIDCNILLKNNSINVGDSLYLNNLYIGTQSVYNYSGQYKVYSVDINSQYITLDISTNTEFVNGLSSSIYPYYLHESNKTLLSNVPYFSLNKGKSIKITRISNSVNLNERYYLKIIDL